MGLAISFSAIMDPRFYVWLIYLLVPFILGTLALGRRKFLKTLVTSLLSLLVTLPFVAFEYFIYIYPSLLVVTSVSKAISAPAFRPDTFSTIAFFSPDATFLFIFDFISEWWTTIAYSPPSILFYPRTKWWYLPTIGREDNVLFPNDPISYIWFASLSIFFILMLISLFDKDRKQYISPLVASLLFLIAIEVGTNFPDTKFTYYLEVAPSHLPIIGGVFATTFAIPFYAEWLNLSIYLILIPISVNYLLNKVKRIRFKIIIPLIIVILFSFASWQYFNGTLYPSQDTGSFPGNSVSLQGYYAPLYPPPQWVHVMNIMSTNNAGRVYVGEIGFSEKWTNYQFILNSPPLMPGWATISPPPVQNISQTPLSYDIAGIRYLFIDNTSYIPLNSYFIYSYLHYSGLIPVVNSSDVYLLEQPNASIFRYSYNALFYNGTDENLVFDVLYNLYPLLNYTPAIVSPVKMQNTIPIVLNPESVLSSQISVYNVTNVTEINIHEGKYIVFNDTDISHISKYILNVSNALVMKVTGILVFVPFTINFSSLVSFPLNYVFTQFTTEFSLHTPKNVFVSSSLPLPSAEVNSGNLYLGHNVFGQLIFYSNGILLLHLKYGELANLLLISVDLLFYGIFAYIIIYKRMLKAVVITLLKRSLKKNI
ncbi:hypothetical protein CM19_01090 [Candidatus Acidianus copahuensis]|uniref:Uncharacterized protein n=1 Tax=Candidatus Acidianus copahuensis TaxID=1160895 RepID=A0A031LSQ8_9CREN|nr:hypothetical protein [Candidatus Acidianus copahuensis]EZQ11417.1 hypothetical protein CM19_01090 [Candidatus Acidianus copahuensis]